MGTLGIYSFQARQQCIRCWTSWGRRALSWDNLIITLLPVFFKSFFSPPCMAGLDMDNCTFCPSQNWRKACGHMGTLGIYSFQARLQCIKCWISWGRQALSWDNLIITSLSVFFKSFFSEDQASCLVEVDEIQLDMKMKVHDGEVIEVGRDVPLGANPANPALYRNFRLVHIEGGYLEKMMVYLSLWSGMHYRFQLSKSGSMLNRHSWHDLLSLAS